MNVWLGSAVLVCICPVSQWSTRKILSVVLLGGGKTFQRQSLAGGVPFIEDPPPCPVLPSCLYPSHVVSRFIPPQASYHDVLHLYRSKQQKATH